MKFYQACRLMRNVLFLLFFSLGLFLCVGCEDSEKERQREKEIMSEKLNYEDQLNQMKIKLEHNRHTNKMEEIDKTQQYKAIALDKTHQHEMALNAKKNEITRYIAKMAVMVILILGGLISMLFIYQKKKKRDLEEQIHVDNLYHEERKLIIEAVKDPSLNSEVKFLLLKLVEKGPRRVGQIEYIHDIDIINENE